MSDGPDETRVEAADAPEQEAKPAPSLAEERMARAQTVYRAIMDATAGLPRGDATTVIGVALGGWIEVQAESAAVPASRFLRAAELNTAMMHTIARYEEGRRQMEAADAAAEATTGPAAAA